MAKKIMIIRHGEKPSDDDSIRGVSKDGSHDPDDLSVRGWQRSGALIGFFAPPHGRFSHPALAVPDALFAEAPSGHIKSQRAKHTIDSLADGLGKHVNLKHTRGEEKALVEDVLATGGAVLIAWEHNSIVEIANRILGDDKSSPQKWHDSRFDVVWVLDFQSPPAVWKFTQVAQMLLPGDSPHPI